MNPQNRSCSLAISLALALAGQACAQPFTKNSNQSRKLRSIVAGGSGNSIPALTRTAVISGGENNTASGQSATIGGGRNNSATSGDATVGGGLQNRASGDVSTIAGGAQNTNSANLGAIGGGLLNEASGQYSTVPGGRRNSATNDYSFAAGHRAKTTKPGQFVWSDSTDFDYWPTTFGSLIDDTRDTFNVRARGGVRFDSGSMGNGGSVVWVGGKTEWTFSSDAATKEGFAEIDAREYLRRLASLPITEWNFKGHTQRNIGPMAQDWHKAFPSLSTSDKVINSGDLQGVSLVAIQGLLEELKDRDKAIGELKAELRALREEVRGKSPPAE